MSCGPGVPECAAAFVAVVGIGKADDDLGRILIGQRKAEEGAIGIGLGGLAAMKRQFLRAIGLAVEHVASAGLLRSVSIDLAHQQNLTRFAVQHGEVTAFGFEVEFL